MSKHAFGYSDRSGFRYPLKDLVEEYRDGKPTGLRVGRDEVDQDHPQLQLDQVRVDDPRPLPFTRPDPSLDASRAISDNVRLTTGTAATLRLGRVDVEVLWALLAEHGDYLASGQVSGLFKASLLNAQQASFTLTAVDADGLSFGYELAAESAAFEVSAQDAGLYATLLMAASQASFTLNAFDSTQAVTGAWSIANAEYHSSINLSPGGGVGRTIHFSPDGDRMYYVYASGGGEIIYFTLSTPWDKATRSQVSTFSFATQMGASNALVSARVSDDGNYLYGIDSDNRRIYQYSLGTPWNPATASYSGVTLNTGAGNSGDFCFANGGTGLLVVDRFNLTVRYFSLGTAWNVATASLVGSYSFPQMTAGSYGIALRDTGSRMYLTTPTTIYQYRLTTSGHPGTAVYERDFSVSSQTSSCRDVFLGRNGSRMWTVDDSHNVFEYVLRDAPDVQMSGEIGSFAMAGQDIGFVRDILFDAAHGGFDVTGQDAALEEGVLTLDAELAELALTGHDAGLARSLLMDGAGIGMDLTTSEVGLSYVSPETNIPFTSLTNMSYTDGDLEGTSAGDNGHARTASTYNPSVSGTGLYIEATVPAAAPNWILFGLSPDAANSSLSTRFQVQDSNLSIWTNSGYRFDKTFAGAGAVLRIEWQPDGDLLFYENGNLLFTTSAGQRITTAQYIKAQVSFGVELHDCVMGET